MQTSTLRRVSLAALVCAAMAAPAVAQQSSPGREGQERHHRHMDRDGHHRHHGGMHHRRAGMGGTMQLLGLVPMRAGVEFRYLEGRLAFMKAELKLNEAQAKQWDAFAAALRENAAKLTEAYKQPDRDAVEKMSPAERIGWYEKALAARLDAVKRARAALEPLYAGLSDDQKKLFDRFVPTGGARAGMRDQMRERMRERREERRDRRRENRGGDDDDKGDKKD